MELIVTHAGSQVLVGVDGRDSHPFDVAEIELTPDDPLFARVDPRPYGARLFQALFKAGTPARQALSALAPGSPLRITAADTELQRVPWEYTRNAGDPTADEGFLALRHVLLRGASPDHQPAAGAPASAAPASAPNGGGLRVLVIASDPLVYANDEPVTALSVERERDALKRDFQTAGVPYRVTFVKPATLDALHEHLSSEQSAIVHILGHGRAAPQGARLLLEDRCGVASLAAAEDVIAATRGRVWLAYLNACQSAMTLDQPASNLAHALVKAGVPYALGMQFEVPEVAALRLSAFFYRFLAQGHSVEASLHQARRALWTHDGLRRIPIRGGGTIDYRAFALGIPVLYTGGAPCEIVRNGPNGEAEAAVIDPQPRMAFDDRIVEAQTFRGRARELAQLGRLFEHGCRTAAEIDDARRRLGRDPHGAQVIVIRGEGGMGKSTLARRAAARFAWRFPGGILGVSLENLPGKDALVARLGQWWLGGAFDRVPEPERESAVTDAARNTAGLLILDNYETLIRALAEKGTPSASAALDLARFVGKLAGGQTVLLITSREQVSGLAGARELLLEGLDTDAGRELFWDYAADRRRDADETLAAQLADGIGGHPLALELLGTAFAGYAGGLPDFLRGLGEQLAQAKSDYKTDRQVTLGGCFDYSFTFLPAETKELFLKLGLFEAPFLASQAQEVLAEPNAGQLLNQLRQRSLTRAVEFAEDTPLYFLHPAARWYIGQKAEPAALGRDYGEAFAGAYGRLARSVYQSFAGRTDLAVVSQARIQWPDLVHARDFMSGRARYEQDFLASYLLRVFGDVSTAMRLLEESRELAEQADDLRHQSLAQHDIAGVLVQLGRIEEAMRLYEQSQQSFEHLGDVREVAVTQSKMAYVLVSLGRIDEAMRLYEQAHKTNELLGDVREVAVAQSKMADVLVSLGRIDKAMRLYEQSLKTKEQLGDVREVAVTQSRMAAVLVQLGRIDEAMRLYEQSLKTVEQLGDVRGVAVTQASMADVLVSLGRIDEAMRLYVQSLKTKEQLGDVRGVAVTQASMADVLVKLGRIDEAMRLYEQSLKTIEQLGEVRSVAVTQSKIADVLVKRGRIDEAMRLYEQSLKTNEQLGDVRSVAVTKANMAQVLFAQRKHADAVNHIWVSYLSLTLLRLPDAKATAQILAGFRSALGSQAFDQVWQQAVADPMPDWLSQAPIESPGQGSSNGLTTEQRRVIVANTIAVMTAAADRCQEWWQAISGARAQAAQKMQAAPDESYLQAILALLEGGQPELPADHPYAQDWRTILDGLAAGQGQ
jgi:tetratricopeptide (TPR) repeat protein